MPVAKTSKSIKASSARKPTTTAKKKNTPAKKPLAKKPVSANKAAEKPTPTSLTSAILKKSPVVSKQAAPKQTRSKLSDVNPANNLTADVKKNKLIRDSYSMPEIEYAVLGKMKKTCLKAGFDIKKSELLRIGVALLSRMDTGSLQRALAQLVPLKSGRPKKHK